MNKFKNGYILEKVLFAVSLLFVGTGYFLMINFVPIQDINLLSDEELLELAKELAINYPVGEKLVLYGKIGIVITIILLACRFLTYIYFSLLMVLTSMLPSKTDTLSLDCISAFSFSSFCIISMLLIRMFSFRVNNLIIL